MARLALTEVDADGGERQDIVLDADPDTTVRDVAAHLAETLGAAGPR